jgi:RNA polymerase sigma-70 factor (ECF subfamily)
VRNQLVPTRAPSKKVESAAKPEAPAGPAAGSASPEGDGGPSAPEVAASPAGVNGHKAARTHGKEVNTPPFEASNRELRAREAEEDRALIAKAQAGDASSPNALSPNASSPNASSPNAASPNREAARAAAFRQLVERHQRRAFAIAFGLVRDENDAHEIVQEAFLRVYKGLATFEGTSSFFTWLYRIVTNLAIDLMRKPGRKAAELDEGKAVDDEPDAPLALVSRIDGADPLDVVRRKEIAARIKTALDALPPYHRSVILMREVEGMSYEEMAEAMDVSKGTIMSRLFHARQKMQKALADCYAEQGYVSRDAAGGAPAESDDDADATTSAEDEA